MRFQQYINEAKGVTFVRFGGLSPVNQKKYGISQNFHKAPANKGIYAFIWPYIETFLFAWKRKTIPLPPEAKEWKDAEWKEYSEQDKKDFDKFYRKEMKKFTYTGYVWTHFTNIPPNFIRKRKGSWVEIHTSDWKQVLKKVKHLDMKEIASDKWMGNINAKDPYKRGLGGNVSRDHLEVFIERI